MKPDVIANWQYLVLVPACAALSGPDPLPDAMGQEGEGRR